MKGVIDRFEGDYAIIELSDRTIKNIRRSLLPYEAKEGDVIEMNEHGEVRIDEDETDDMKKEIEKLMDDVWGD